MEIIRPSTTINSSTASSKIDEDDNETVQVKNYVKELLKSRIFLGRYLERRLANQLIGYRDIVLLSAAEVELKKDLFEAHHKLRSIRPNHWIGITDGESLGYHKSICLWTEIDNQPLGPFWFQIKGIKFKDYEVIIVLKCVRHISEAYLEIEPILTGSTERKTKMSDKQPDINNTSESFSEIYNEFVGTVKSALNISNVKEFFTFIFALIIAIFTGSTAFVSFLGNFVLALIREISIFIKNSTPMFLGVLDFMSKIVGGFYILLAMFFRPSNPPPKNRRAVTYYDHHRPRESRHYDYDDKCFD